MTIRFYSTSAEHGAFSNFAVYPFKLDGHSWRTSEHYYQASKFLGAPEFDLIRKARTPELAAKLGRSRRVRLRPDWERTKVHVMRRALEAKFRQHADLTTLLLSTGDEELIEDTDTDCFWGDGRDGKGRNRLGHLLMELRATLREERVGA